MSRKPRIDADGPGPLQRLKSLPWEEVEFLLSQREKISAAKLAAQISSRHGIDISAPRLSDFWRWAESQVALRVMNADAEQFRTEFARENPGATLEEAHESTLAYLHLKAGRSEDEKLMKFVLGEIRKARALAHEREKFREELKGKLEKGLDALFQEIKGNARALELFEELKGALAK